MKRVREGVIEIEERKNERNIVMFQQFTDALKDSWEDLVSKQDLKKKENR